MPIDRRSFLAAAASAAPLQAEPQHDPLGVRADFPIASELVYLNSAYIAPVSKAVVAAGRNYIEGKSARPMRVGALMATNDAVRAQFARLVNATPDEIALLNSTGEGESVIANGIGLRPGDNVVVDDLHYTTEFVLYRELEASRGIELRIARSREGAVTAADFEKHVDKRTRIVSVAWVSHLNGFRHDLRPIADLAHAHGALFYADAVQAAGMIDLDVQASGVDAMCCGSYKWLMSEFGVAPFFISKRVIDRVQSDRIGEFSVMRADPEYRFQLFQTARKFEGTSRAFGAVAQLQAALSYLEKVGVPRIEAHTTGLAKQLYGGLQGQGHRMLTPPGNRSSIVALRNDRPAADVLKLFQSARIEVTVRGGQIRIAPALFNNADEIEQCLAVTKSLV
ncbi:MAG: aminotransferase class V-fold PLP-dependent enzyme [Bryobacteraceae bacterium]|nr:aminotransferase class V-fold PLP-dependent enzyme [Bryobacteraceae bacterium]